MISSNRAFIGRQPVQLTPNLKNHLYMLSSGAPGWIMWRTLVERVVLPRFSHYFLLALNFCDVSRVTITRPHTIGILATLTLDRYKEKTVGSDGKLGIF